jgi:ribosomal protein S18 acetylase RimI-like enzyme
MFKYTEGIQNITPAEIMELYKSVGWSSYTEKPDKLMKSLTNSTYLLICRDDDKLIGLIRSLTDDSAVNYIQDILVHTDYQRRGIGRELLNRVLKKYNHVRTHILLTDDETKQKLFYESTGFRNIKTLKKQTLNCYVKMNGITLE